MAITYPLSLPSSIGISSVEFSTTNATAISRSPFSFKEQVLDYGGALWSAKVTVPITRRDVSADWVAFMTSLKGQEGTFLLGNPDYATPRGDVSSCTINGNVGDESVTATMTGTLKAGDYIQLGSGSSAELHMVLQDLTGDGTLEIWPGLRATYTTGTATFNDAKGVFRLANRGFSYAIDSASFYSIQFEAVEAIS